MKGSYTLGVKQREADIMGEKHAREDNREQIIQAAIRQFAENGTKKTTLEDIAQCAGVTKKTVLNHYGSKDRLIFLATERCFEETLEDVRLLTLEAAYQTVTGAEQIVMLLVKRAKYFMEKPYIVTLVNEAENLVSTGAIEKEFSIRYWHKPAALSNYLRHALEKGIQDGSVRPDIDFEEADNFLLFSWRTLAQRLMQIHMSEEGQKQIDTIGIMRAQLSVVKRYLTH